LEVNAKVLDLTEKRIGDDGLKAVSQYILNNKVIFTNLELFGNELTDDCIKHLIAILQKQPYLKSINLEFNHITNDGAKEFCDFLSTNNTSMSRLILYANRLTDDSCPTFAKMFEKNIYLKELSLSQNQIGNPGAVSLLLGLKSNTIITKVNISNNSIDDELSDIFDEIMSRNNGDKGQKISEIPPKFLKVYETKLSAKEDSSPIVTNNVSINIKSNISNNNNNNYNLAHNNTSSSVLKSTSGFDFNMDINSLKDDKELFKKFEELFNYSKVLKQRNDELERFVDVVKSNFPSN